APQHVQVDAVVYDAPVFLFYAAHEGKGKVQTAGAIFRKENYGIVFPSNSPYRQPVTEALLKLKENGTYDQLYTKWFGGNGSESPLGVRVLGRGAGENSHRERDALSQ